MTRPDLDALAALVDKATPGPWCGGDTDRQMSAIALFGHWDSKSNRYPVIARFAAPHKRFGPSTIDEAFYNKDLIVAAVNALPSLIAYVRELERERDALADEAGAMRLRAEAAESDLKEDRYDNMQEWKRIAALAMRERCAQLLNITRSDAQLMAGDMTAGEWRTVSAVLRNRAAAIRALKV